MKSKMNLKASSFLMVFVGFVAVRSQSTCLDLKTCIDEIFESGQGQSIRVPRGLARCDTGIQRDVNSLIDLQRRRHSMVSDCIANGPEPGPAHRCPEAFLRTKRQAPFVRSAMKEKTKQCMQRIADGGCKDKSQICHQCYEMSAIHDDIHRMKIKLSLARAKCWRRSRSRLSDEGAVPSASDFDLQFFDTQ